MCEPKCVSCLASNSSVCIECAEGHALKDDGRCVKCLGSCSGSCDPRNISICLSCIDGFELIDNACERCSYGCISCLNGDCLECMDGFSVMENSDGSFSCK